MHSMRAIFQNLIDDQIIDLEPYFRQKQVKPYKQVSEMLCTLVHCSQSKFRIDNLINNNKY